MTAAEIRLEGAPNFRDLGGYLTADGRSVCRGRVFRSGSLANLSNNDFATLSKLGLRLVCDLRSELERKKKATVWPDTFVPATLYMGINADPRAGNATILDMLREDPTERGAIALMTAVYRLVPGMLAKNVATIFSALVADDKVPLVFHCTAGKDRTGVLSAIILLALGVPRDAVYEDYLKSGKNQDQSKMQAQLAESLVSIYAPEAPPREVLSALIDVRESYLDAAMIAMGEKHGRIDEYFECAGIATSQLELLRSTLLK